jgi:hypothetical protein
MWPVLPKADAYLLGAGVVLVDLHLNGCGCAPTVSAAILMCRHIGKVRLPFGAIARRPADAL